LSAQANFVGDFLRRVLRLIGNFFSSLFAAETGILDNVSRIQQNFETARSNVQREVEALRAFQFDPKWKNRVINVPIAVAQLQDFVDLITQDWRERLRILTAPVHEFVLIFHAEEFGERPSGLVRAAVKVDEIATLVKQLADATDQVVSFVDVFRQLREQIEGLDGAFLQQGNSRQVVREKSTIRLGALHGG
jgi:hypothetical protein